MYVQLVCYNGMVYNIDNNTPYFEQSLTLLVFTIAKSDVDQF